MATHEQKFILVTAIVQAETVKLRVQVVIEEAAEFRFRDTLLQRASCGVCNASRRTLDPSSNVLVTTVTSCPQDTSQYPETSLCGFDPACECYVSWSVG